MYCDIITLFSFGFLPDMDILGILATYMDMQFSRGTYACMDE